MIPPRRLQPNWPALLAGLLAAGGGAAEARWDPGPLHWDRVTVVEVAPEPCCGSGTIAVYVRILGESAKHGRRAYLMPFMIRGQRAPKIGDRCRLSYRRHDVNGMISGETVATLAEARVISAFRCGKDRARRPGE